MATNLLTPKSSEPKGIPPKNILAFVALCILVLIGLGAIYLQNDQPSASQGETKDATLQQATATKDIGIKGDPKDVTSAADRAGVPATLRGDLPSASVQAARSSADKPPSAGQPGSPPMPFPLPETVGTAGAVAARASPESIDAIRDTEISNAKPLVVDFGGSSSDASSKTATDPIERLIQSQRADSTQRSQAVAKAADMSQYSGLMSGGPQSKSNSPTRDADKAFLKEISSNRREPGIRASAPESPLIVAQGSSIEAVILREINSDLPGVITARTTRDIYDTTTVTKLVIPRGSTIIGEYSSEVRSGQSRLLFAFSRLILPDGQSFDLNGFTGSDAQGRSGLEADVDNHYFRLFGTSLLIGLLADRVVRRDVVPQGVTGTSGGGGLTATGHILTDNVRSILDRNREVSPTLSIQKGTRVLIDVRRDMIFPSPYKG